MGKRTIQVMVCDNPDCDYRDEHTRDEAALGYYIDRGQYHYGGGGGPIPKTFACSPACLGPAVDAMIRQSEEN